MKHIIIENEFKKNRKTVIQFFFLRFSTYSNITGNAHHQINGGKKTNIKLWPKIQKLLGVTTH